MTDLLNSISLVSEAVALYLTNLMMYCMFVMQLNSNRWHQHIYPCTTDPGTYFLNHPMNKSGTALLKHGQYEKGYQLDCIEENTKH